MPATQLASRSDKGHGRLEKRTLRTTSILTLHEKWPGLKQGFELTRRRTVKGVTTVEVVYGITSLSVEQADARRLLGLTRGHWGIENKLHYVRDETLGEDRCRVGTGDSAQVLAAVRHVVVHLLEGVRAASKAAATRRFAAHPEEAVTLLFT